MAAIDPGIRPHDGVERFTRPATRLLAVAAYAVALAVAFSILSPVLPSVRSEPATEVVVAEEAQLYRLGRGETLELAAARNAISLERLLALNPGLDSFALEKGLEIRIG